MITNNHEHRLTFIAAISMAYFLSGCAGSGSNNSVSSSPFSLWNATGAGATVTFSQGQGISSSVSVDQSVSASNNASGVMAFDSARNLTSFSFNSGAGATIKINSANGDTILKNFGGSSSVAYDKNKTQMAIIADPYYMGYEYQTYGAWGSYANSNTSSHGFVVGNPTPGSSIPLTGSGTFIGSMTGYFTDSAKNGYLAFANMTATYDFAQRSLNLSTNNTALVGAPSGNPVLAPGLNITSTLIYNAGTNRLNGTVSTVNGLSGNMVGQFYGPAANEVGGTFSAQNPSVGSFVGGFGGKR